MLKTVDFSEEQWQVAAQLRYENEELKRKIDAYKEEVASLRYELDKVNKDAVLGKALRTILKEVGK